MAYTKHTWQCGESISADLLNHMEQGIEDASGGGSGDCGYECVTAYTEILNESVTTADEYGDGYSMGMFSDATVSDIPQIRVTFNGVEYICEFNENDGDYGAPWDNDLNNYDWSEYPFNISSGMLTTQNSGIYSVKVESVESSIETMTPCFEKAVKTVVESIDKLFTKIRYMGEYGTGIPLTSDGVTGTINADTLQEINDAIYYNPIIETADNSFGALIEVPLMFGGRKQGDINTVLFYTCQTVLELNTSTGAYTIHYNDPTA